MAISNGALSWSLALGFLRYYWQKNRTWDPLQNLPWWREKVKLRASSMIWSTTQKQMPQHELITFLYRERESNYIPHQFITLFFWATFITLNSLCLCFSGPHHPQYTLYFYKQLSSRLSTEVAYPFNFWVFQIFMSCLSR